MLLAAQSGQFLVESEDGARSLRILGKIDSDWAGFDADPGLSAVAGPFGDGAELRRARLGVAGRLEDWLSFRINADLADADIRDAFFDLDAIGGGNLRLGHFREPMGLTNQTPSHNQVFMERALSSGLFPSRNLGAAWRHAFDGRRGSWTVGVFRDSDDAAVSSDDGGGQEFALTSRLAWLLHENSSQRQWTHLGASLSWRNPDAGAVHFDGHSGTKIGPDPVDTGVLPADQVQLFGTEFAWESRPYRHGRAAVWRVTPDHPFHPDGGGWGAWEVGARLSALDLEDSGVTGGQGLNAGLACNWYLTSNLRLQTNVFRSERDF